MCMHMDLMAENTNPVWPSSSMTPAGAPRIVPEGVRTNVQKWDDKNALEQERALLRTADCLTMLI